uniref:PPM-type phosphatase domain-containing protein n=1 Tax=viral metagenome TaxID=1070528 RepID=A0A6C0EUC8_9ZZZZ
MASLSNCEIVCEASSRQLGSNQDHCVCGEINNGYFVGVLDGHGTNDCINELRKINYVEIASNESPSQAIFDKVENLKLNLYGSGSTFTFAKIIIDDEIHIQISNVGDSETYVFVNGELVFETAIHCLSNRLEQERVASYLKFPGPISPAWAPTPISESRMTNVRSDVCNFKTGEKLVPTQSLGHNNMTGYAPEIKMITCKKTDKVRVLCGSDGFWDMIIKEKDMNDLLCMSTHDLLTKAEERWTQTWEYAADPTKLYDFIKTNFGGSYDDVSVAIWEN